MNSAAEDRDLAGEGRGGSEIRRESRVARRGERGWVCAPPFFQGRRERARRLQCCIAGDGADRTEGERGRRPGVLQCRYGVGSARLAPREDCRCGRTGQMERQDPASLPGTSPLPRSSPLSISLPLPSPPAGGTRSSCTVGERLERTHAHLSTLVGRALHTQVHRHMPRKESRVRNSPSCKGLEELQRGWKGGSLGGQSTRLCIPHHLLKRPREWRIAPPRQWDITPPPLYRVRDFP